MSDDRLPLQIRDLPPGQGYTRLTGTRADGLPDGVHTGGAWLDPDGRFVWKPLDGRPWVDADYHTPTREAELLELLADRPGFPRNWRVEEAGAIEVDGRTYTRRWLVREKAWVVPRDYPARALRLADVLAIEQGLRAMNALGWSVGDALTVAFDRQRRPFILDLSTAWPDSIADDERRFLKWCEQSGFDRLAALRQRARRLVDSVDWLTAHPDYCHVYASRNRPASPIWCSVGDALFVDADYDETGVWTWVVGREPLDPGATRRYELTWAWSPIRS